MKHKITLKINGHLHELLVEPRLTLLEAIRNVIGLTGTKRGCDMGDCGACTIIVNNKPVNSCLFLAVEADGSDVITIEGLRRESGLHPIQKSFIDHGAIQCGFCTPGMIISAKSLLDKCKSPDENMIKESISGNLCRCTGYIKIIEAIKKLAEAEIERT
jgi:carbon-monoxide dehydrogenase small subunit